jgi:hypothetical protein
MDCYRCSYGNDAVLGTRQQQGKRPEKVVRRGLIIGDGVSTPHSHPSRSSHNTNDCRALYVCREVATGSKQMRKSKVDPDVRAKAEWHKGLATVGLVNAGDYVMSLTIGDGKDELDSIRWFRDENWIKTEKRLPTK